MGKIKYYILLFFIHGSLLAVEVINDCQYQENNILDLHFFIEHPKLKANPNNELF